MAQVIIYRQDSGLVAVDYPTDEALALMNIHEIAARVVPTGSPYKIIDEADLPADRSQRMAWTVDDVELTDGVGA